MLLIMWTMWREFNLVCVCEDADTQKGRNQCVTCDTVENRGGWRPSNTFFSAVKKSGEPKNAADNEDNKEHTDNAAA